MTYIKTELLRSHVCVGFDEIIHCEQSFILITAVENRHCSQFHWSLFFRVFTSLMFCSSSGWRFCSMEGNTLFCGDTVNFRRFTGSWRRFCELLISPVRETSTCEPNHWSKDDRNWRTTSRCRYLLFIQVFIMLLRHFSIYSYLVKSFVFSEYI